jgi:hypothetical protein
LIEQINLLIVLDRGTRNLKIIPTCFSFMRGIVKPITEVKNRQNMGLGKKSLALNIKDLDWGFKFKIYIKLPFKSMMPYLRLYKYDPKV